ncbi:MAG: VCBS repeat-containing protein, partial [Okeania sp. SIO3B3]|nr:VCBS repeat-containing protein [Okeania sp. SIO3B3]
VVGNTGQPNQVYFNDGTGVFSDTGQTIGADATNAIALQDLDDDGSLDLFIGNEGSNEIYLNDGTGVFSSTGQSLADLNTNTIALGDLNGDGTTDAFEGNGTEQQGEANIIWLNLAPTIFRVTEGRDQRISIPAARNLVTTIIVPADAISETTVFTYTPYVLPTQPVSPTLGFAGQAFTLNGPNGSGLLDSTVFSGSITMTLTYETGLSEEELRLYFWDVANETWVDAATSCNPTSTYVRDTENNELSVAICHLTDFSVFGPALSGYIPMILQGAQPN